MGYTTDFAGAFNLNTPLTNEHKSYLAKFNETRRMKRKQTAASKLSDPFRIAVGLPIGKEGAYFVGGKGDFGQDDDDSVADHNYPPAGQPSLWCGWTSNEDGTAIVWDGGEKFYSYVEWIEYLIEHFLKPWGYTLNGEIEWVGEDSNDRGKIVIDNNTVKTMVGRIVYEEVE